MSVKEKIDATLVSSQEFYNFSVKLAIYPCFQFKLSLSYWLVALATDVHGELIIFKNWIRLNYSFVQNVWSIFIKKNSKLHLGL